MSVPLLIADDSAMSRKLVSRALPADWDVEITQAKNGKEALDYCRQGKADVMLLDITMPELDGFGVLEKIKAENLKSVVIVISADIQPKARERVLSLGAVAFVKKPVDKDELRQVLHEYGLL